MSFVMIWIGIDLVLQWLFLPYSSILHILENSLQFSGVIVIRIIHCRLLGIPDIKNYIVASDIAFISVWLFKSQIQSYTTFPAQNDRQIKWDRYVRVENVRNGTQWLYSFSFTIMCLWYWNIMSIIIIRNILCKGN